MTRLLLLSYLLALKFVPYWFSTSNMIEKLDNAVFSNDYIIFYDTDSDILTLFSNDIGLNSISLNNVNLEDDNFSDCDLATINHVRFKAWYNKYEQQKESKKNRCRIIACSIASSKSVGLVHVTR